MKHSNFSLSYLAAFVAITLSNEALSSVVRNDVDYQYFRDFAENKGQFTVGATNIPIKDKNGQFIGTMLNGLPMVDFSPMVRSGHATLVAPQYIVSVAHNSGYQDVEFGIAGINPDAHHYRYKLVDRNDYEKVEGGLDTDYHTPRLNKLVTEVAPAYVTNAGSATQAYLDETRFPMFLRAGAGRQALRGKESNQTTEIAGSYQYLTGGTTLQLSKNSPANWLDHTSNLYQVSYGPLSSYALPGDSGSGSYAYDAKEKRWVLVSVLNFYSGIDQHLNRSAIIRKDFHERKFAEDNAGTLENNSANAVFNWTAQGKSSTISQTNNAQKINVSIADASQTDNTNYPKGSAGVVEVLLPKENHGKTVNITGKDATIVLKNNIDQGAGALNLNANVTVRAENNQTWVGAGIIVGKDKQVIWQVKNPQGDRLSKLGEGLLHINGSGENLGDISVGEGTVILNQQADRQGKKQAFNQVGIVSGRGNVILNSADQVNPNRIYFGSGGGRLDLNGNNLTFKRIQNVDQGARIVNNSRNTSTLTIQGQDLYNTQDLVWGKWEQAGADIYEYINPHQSNRKDYFALKNDPKRFFPIDGQSNEHWEFLSSNKDEAMRKILDRKRLTQRYDTFNGFIGETDTTRTNGGLNLVVDTQVQPQTSAKERDLVWGKWSESGADIYEYINTHRKKRKDYFMLKGDANSYFPLDQNNSEDWIFLSSNKRDAIRKALEYKNAALTEKEKLNNIYTISGGLNLNGNLTVNGGKLLLSGRPTPHAYDVLNKKDVVYADDWQNSQFNAQNMNVTKWSQLYIERNVSAVNANFSATDNAQLNLGFINQKTPSCYDSEYTGQTHCEVQAVVSNEIFANMPTTRIQGNTQLRNQSQLNLGKATLIGTVQADNATQVSLANHAHWINSGDSRLGNLQAERGSIITLNTAFDEQTVPTRFHTLMINGNMKGEARINYVTRLETAESDRVEVNGIAEGQFTLALRNSGKEIAGNTPISLLRLTHSDQAKHKVEVALEKGYVDFGAYRYLLKNNQNDYQLYNALKPASSETHTANNTVVTPTTANADIEKQKQEVARLTQALEEKRKTDTQAQQALATAQSQLDQANTQLVRLEQQLSKYRRNTYYYRQLAGQVNSAKQKVTQAQTALSKAKESATLSADQLKIAEQALLSVKNVATRSALDNSIQLMPASDQGHTDIHQSDWVSQYANTALSELSAQANSALQIGQGLDRQLANQHDKFHLWSSLEHQKTEHKSDLYRPYEQQTNLTQLGVELPLANGINAGVVLSRNHANAEFDEGVNGKSNLLMASLYGKWHSENGTFASLDASYGKAKNRINLFGENRFNRHIMAIGANLGHHFDLAGVQVQPMVGARYYHFSAQDYTLGEVAVNSPRANFMAYQAGVKVSKAFDLSGWKVEPSLAAHYVDASSKRLNVAVNDNTFSQRFGRYLKTEVGVGVARGQWQLSTHLGLLKGNEINKQHFAGFKLGYSW